MNTVPGYLQNLINLIRIVLVVLAVYAVYDQMHRPSDLSGDRQTPNYYRPSTASDQSSSFSGDEKRIARRFLNDTIPGLMRNGLIKLYERKNDSTLVTVAGPLWRRQSEYFKLSLLTEMMVYDKVNGFGYRTKIIDSLSGNIYAEISSEGGMKFYD